ncbi:MAG: TonB-dependent receptor [Rhodanobacter sp.]
MNLKTKKVSSAVRLALSVGAVIAAGSSMAAFAQEATSAPTQQSDQANQAKATELKAVVVTGSNIRRVDLETSNPVVSVDRAVIEASGAVTLGDLVQDLPAMTGSNTNAQNSGSGVSTVNLRGLGPDRTLILVDGRRVLSQDVNVIPANMIERIDVLTTGASSVYGSDAVGGVVNFITKKDFKGAQITSNYGQSSRHDAKRRGASVTVGQSSDKGSITAGVGYSKSDIVLASAREFSKNTLSLIGSAGGHIQSFIGGSGSSPFGNIQLPSSGPIHDAYAGCASNHVAVNRNATSGLDPIADYHCYQNSGPNSDKYNYASQNPLIAPQERSNGFVLSNYRFTDHITGYLDAYYVKTSSLSQNAPSLWGSPYGAKISADNYYNPFGIAYGRTDSQFLSRLVALSDRVTHASRNDAQIHTGLKGDFTVFDQGWNWDAGFDYGYASQSNTSSGYASNNKLYTGPSFLGANGVVQCGQPGNVIANCDASFDPFVMFSPNSKAALQKAAVITNNGSHGQQKVWRASMNGGVFDLPAGSVQLALGADYRQEHTESRVDALQLIDPTTGTCILGSGCSTGLQGGFNVKEAYAEVFVPILQGLPFVDSLNVTVGDRYSRFSSFGSTNNKSFAAEWRPIRDLLLRGTIAEVFRAPTITDVYTAPGASASNLNFDPCDGYTGSPINPACVNVPSNGSFRNTNVAQAQATSITSAGSNAAGFPIRPESGKSYDFGAVYSPSWANGLSASVDFWRLELNDIITQVRIQSLMNLCSAGQTTYCAFIHRIPSGPQQGQLDLSTTEPTGNLGSVSVAGVDGGLAYRLGTESFGNFNFMLNATYLSRYDQQTAPGLVGNTTYHNAGHFDGFGSAPAAACGGGNECLFPRIRATGNVLWQMGNWRASWKLDFIGGYRMGSPSPSQDTFPVGGKLKDIYYDYGATTYHDVTVGYDLEPLHTRLDLGVDNVFDHQPPLLYANNVVRNNTARGSFDAIGRYYWARITVTF